MEIINNIEDPICNQEVAQYLENKGFNAETEANYWIFLDDHIDNYRNHQPYDWSKVFFTKNHDEYNTKISIDENNEHATLHVLSVPTLAVATEWVRVNFNHDVEARPVRYAGDTKSSYYQPYVNGCIVDLKRYDSPQNAMNAALLHVLKTMI